MTHPPKKTIAELARAGRHADAVQAATSALAAPGLPAYAALRGRMPVTPLGPVQLKGKAASVDVFAVDA